METKEKEEEEAKEGHDDDDARTKGGYKQRGRRSCQAREERAATHKTSPQKLGGVRACLFLFAVKERKLPKICLGSLTCTFFFSFRAIIHQKSEGGGYPFSSPPPLLLSARGNSRRRRRRKKSGVGSPLFFFSFPDRFADTSLSPLPRKEKKGGKRCMERRRRTVHLFPPPSHGGGSKGGKSGGGEAQSNK